MEKKSFIPAEIELVKLEDDIITASGCYDSPNSINWGNYGLSGGFEVCS